MAATVGTSGAMGGPAEGASDVRGFQAWLNAGRVVCKGQKGVKIVAPEQIADGTVRSIKPVYVFDVSQTQERTPRAAA